MQGGMYKCMIQNENTLTNFKWYNSWLPYDLKRKGKCKQ